jgi:peroxiredoxin family protein
VARGPANLAFRYAATAAALDLSVEIHVVGESVKILQRSLAPSPELASSVANEKLAATLDHTDAPGIVDKSREAGAFSHRDLLSQIREMKAMGVHLFACSAAMADAGLAATDLIAEVDGVRGAAALLAAGMADDARFMSF